MQVLKVWRLLFIHGKYMSTCVEIFENYLKEQWESKLHRNMNPCQHDYWGKDSFKCNAGKKEKNYGFKKYLVSSPCLQ